MEEAIRILVVDDDPAFGDLTAERLEREDDRFAVETATGADDALDRLPGGIDCVVSDYDMPGTTGIELLEAVREKYPDLPFILFTGKGSEEVASDAISAGVTDYLRKRSGREGYELLANRVRNAIEGVRARRQATEQRRISTVVREINRALVGATTREEINRRVTEILSESDPYVFAWIGRVDGTTGRIEPETAAGVEEGYLADVEITVDDTATGRGPAGVAVREGAITVSQNIQDDADFAPWREAALERGYRAAAAVPLIYDERRYGVLAIYADRPQAFDESERSLLSDLGDTIAHAYHRIEVGRGYRDQYRELFEEAPVMFAFTRATDDGPVIEDCNRLFAETLGYEPEELRGTPLAEVYTEESARELLDGGGYDRALGGEFVREQREFRTRDGDRVVTLLRATPRRNADGEIVGTHALYVDVTDQVRLERLEQFRERMEFALDATDSVLFEIDLETGSETRHGPFERLYGIDPERVATTEEFYERCIHPDDRDQVREIQRPEHLAEASGNIEYEFRTNPETGEERWIWFRAYVPADGDGTPKRLIGLNTDITERKERERQLERLHDATVDFVDATDDRQIAENAVEAAVDVLDFPLAMVRFYDPEADGLVPIAWSDRVDEVFGDRPVFTAGDGSFNWETYETGDPQLLDDISRVDRAADSDTPIRSLLVFPLGDHGTLSAGATTVSEFDESDVFLGRILATATEAALDRADRETELRRQRDALERQNERLEEFASVLSHDLRNPLQVAKARTEMAREDPAGDHFDAIERAHDRMESLIEDILTLARERGKVTETEPVDLATLVEECWRNVETTDATLRVETDRVVRADRSRVQRLVENLVRNAVQHGGDDVTVTVGDLDGGFYVADDGPGIPAEKRDRVFESGYSTVQGGTGFGLAIVERIAEVHRWTVGLAESENGGARFEFTGVEFAD